MNAFKFVALFALVAFVSAQLPPLPPGFVDTVVFDDFVIESPALIIVTSTSNVGSTIIGFTTNSGILGGERDLSITFTAGASNLVLSCGVANGLYSAAAPNGADGISQLVYDGVDGSATISLDIIEIDFFQAGSNAMRTVASADLNTVIIFIAYANGKECTAQINIPQGDTPTGYLIPYSSFSGGCDFSSVQALEIQLPIASNVDVNLRLISLYGPAPSATPTPTRTPAPTQSNTPAPSASRTPTPGPSQSRTPAPTASNTSAPSQSRSNTPGPSQSRTPAPTASNTPAPSQSRSSTPAPSETRTPAPTASNTSAPSQSRSSTPAPSQSNTPTPAPSPSRTPTPAPSSSPSVSPSNSPTPSDTCICKCPLFTCEIFRVDDGDYVYYRGFFDTFRNVPDFFNTIFNN